MGDKGTTLPSQWRHLQQTPNQLSDGHFGIHGQRTDHRSTTAGIVPCSNLPNKGAHIYDDKRDFIDI